MIVKARVFESWGSMRGVLRSHFTFNEIKEIAGAAGVPAHPLTGLQQNGPRPTSKAVLIDAIIRLIEDLPPGRRDRVTESAIQEMLRRRPDCAQELHGALERAGVAVRAAAPHPRDDPPDELKTDTGSAPAGASAPVEVFYSYSHKDMKLRDKLETALANLKRQCVITSWHDRQIQAGAEWEKAIDAHLNSAKIILLLISPDFMDSDYCYGKEMKRALARHDAGEAVVIPIILRDTDLAGRAL